MVSVACAATAMRRQAERPEKRHSKGKPSKEDSTTLEEATHTGTIDYWRTTEKRHPGSTSIDFVYF